MTDHDETAGQPVFTERERRLVREAAVMAYLQGRLSAGYIVPRAEYPKDSAVVQLVLDSATAHDDLYPHLAAMAEARTTAPTPPPDPAAGPTAGPGSVAAADTERVLREHGMTDQPDRYDASIHSWRCEHPDRYGPCTCLGELVDDLTALTTHPESSRT